MPRPEYYVYQENALDKAGWFARLAFLWMWRFFLKNYNRTMGVHHLFLPPKSALSQPLTEQLQGQWEKQASTQNPSLIYALLRVFGVHYAWLALLALLMQCVVQVMEILCMQWLCDALAHVNEDPETRSLVYRNAIGICVLQLLSVLLNHHYFFRTFRLGMNVRVACSGLMYRKYLRLHPSALVTLSPAHVLSLATDDANRFDLAFVHLHFLLLGPIQIIVVLCVLWPLFGIASAAAVILLFLYLPFQAALGSAFSALRVRTSQFTELRVCKTLELFQAMTVLKMYAWERAFARLVHAARRREVAMIRKSALLKGLNLGIYFISSKLVVHLMLVLYVLCGGRLNPSHVFAGLCFINQLRTSVTLYFPYAVSQGSEGLIALKRVQQFLMLPEQNESSIQEADGCVSGCPRHNSFKEGLINSAFEQMDGETLAAEAAEDAPESPDSLITPSFVLGEKIQTNANSESTDELQNDKNDAKSENDSNKNLSSPSLLEEDEEPEIKAENFSAHWCRRPQCLRDLSFAVRGPQLVAVVGALGAGKSSLLLAMLNELCVTRGRMSVKGIISYSPQQSWMFAGTLRENITFGKPFNLPRYKRVVSVCGLKRDLEQFPHGDRTYVGERTELLSGGQKARVCLARAIYHEADIYLLDDPLSAVDGAVAKHIFERCIKRHLANKLVILVTHQLHFLKSANHILLLKEGRLVCAGDYTDLLAKSGEFFRFQAAAASNLVASAASGPISVQPEIISANAFGPDEPDGDQMSLCGGEQSMPGTPQLSRIGRRISMRRQSSRLSDVMPYCMENSYEDEDPAELAYEREIIAVNPIVKPANVPQNQSSPNVAYAWWHHRQRSQAGHWIYLRNGAKSNWLLCSVILAFVLAQFLYTGSDYWLCCWAELQSQTSSHLDLITANMASNTTSLLSLNNTNNTIEMTNCLPWLLADRPIDNLIIYALIILAVCIFSLWRTLAFFVWCMRISVHLHQGLFYSLSRCSLALFEQRPLGILLNRCSRDMAIIDDMLPATIYDALATLCMNVACILLICLLQVRMVVASAILLALFALLLRLYLPTARQVRHLEAATRSPLYAHLCTSMQGLVSIRALKVQPTFMQLFYARQDTHSSAWFAFLASSRWFGVQMDWLCSLFIAAVVLNSALEMDAAAAGLVALAITSAINLTADFQWGMRQLAEASSQLSAVQRVDQFSHLPDEQQPHAAHAIPKDWPSEGEIEFVRVSLVYTRPGEQKDVSESANSNNLITRSTHGQYTANNTQVVTNAPVQSGTNTTPNSTSGITALHCVSFCIQAGEKIGVVGRTGAGKSSITAALFRLAEPAGSIFIDHVDTRSIPLRHLRQSISIIPQEPLLFSDSLRLNLDPFGEYDDERLWKALERVQLKQLVNELPGALDTQFNESGSSFSVGQKQLLCLARAILKQNKILILDEATANVDPRTDALIQQTIRSEFAQCTVLTIAHRLNTVMDSDRILVLDNGKVVEFDVPALLLRNESGLFSSMVAATGRETSKKLRLIANTKHIQGMI